MKNQGTVYLIHFDKPYKHAKHYLGFSENGIKKRLESHRLGTGAKLLAVLNKQGIEYSIVKIWRHVNRDFERHLKNKKNTPRFCPVCKNNKRNDKVS